MRDKVKVELVDVLFINPIQRFIGRSTTSGIMLFVMAVIAMILANSPLQEWYHDIWKVHFRIGFGEHMIDKDLHHWINDGLMAVFFFVVGLELKREIISGELSNPKNAILPLGAAIGGMIFPALIYIMFNPTGEPNNGWGVPMATDIAFALGLLYLIGNKVPVTLKIFLTALAIADDIGAVLIIAFFYTSHIEINSLIVAALFLTAMIVANKIGVRSALFYAIVGIAGLWVAFLMSGIHATIAAVLAALTIPASAKIPENIFSNKMKGLLNKFVALDPTREPTLTHDQLMVLDKMKNMSDRAIPPLQKLEHNMHPFVSFIVMPTFAFANAGVTIEGEFTQLITSPVTLGVIAGLVLGKVVGVYAISWLLVKLKIAPLPLGMNKLHLLGAGFLASIGFTMSLFIAGLAFSDPLYDMQAKIGVLCATLIGSIMGFIIITIANNRNMEIDPEETVSQEIVH